MNSVVAEFIVPVSVSLREEKPRSNLDREAMRLPHPDVDGARHDKEQSV